MRARRSPTRADIYSLGVMLYQLLTGQVPRGAWKAPSTLMGTDPRLDAVVLRAMEPERNERYQSVAEMRADINRIISTRLSRGTPSAEPHAITDAAHAGSQVSVTPSE